jgi:hypothetical protein
VTRGGLETLRRTRFLYTEYSDVELCGGQLPLDALLALPPPFEALARYPCDVLLENRILREAHANARLHEVSRATNRRRGCEAAPISLCCLS